MAAVPPTSSTLGSWEEAFNHPLPVVRKLESQLRTQILDNQTKLRSLVGASYRDLLGTAERIIEMDGQMQDVEGNLASIGRRCDYRAVERSRQNLGGLAKAGGEGQEKKLEVLARVKVLKGALDAVGRVVRKGGNTLGAAKVLVLARLLHKSVSESENAPPVLAELRKKLAGARRRLLAFIERSLRQTTADRTDLINTLCAYAMITSSAPKEVLRHFLQVRYEQLESHAETPTETNIVAMLDLYGKTLVDTRDLVPRRLSEALAQLSKAPLLQDKQVTSIEELNLDIYQRWIPEDIRTFTPWVRNDQLTASETNEGLKTWAKQAQKSFINALEESLRTQQDAQIVLSTRRSVLSKFLSVSSRTRNENFTQSVTDLQNVFLSRLKELAAKSADMHRFALKSLEDSSRITPSTARSSPWTLATQSLDLNAGALAFRAAIIDHRHGRNEPVKVEHDALDRWTAQLNSHWDFVSSMRAEKWDDDLEFDLEDLEYDGDESLQNALSRVDATKVERKLRDSTAEAFKKAYSKVEKASQAQKDQAAYFVRILRELDQRRQTLGEKAVASQEESKTLNHDAMISSLHNALAEQACKQPSQAFITALPKQHTVAVSLWDGTPALPTQPSPSAFRLLTALQASMAEIGDDVWSNSAVEALKEHLRKQLAQSMAISFPPPEQQPSADSKEADEAPEESAEKDSSTHEKNLRIQRLFDALYFSSAFGSLELTVSKLREVAGVDEAGKERVAKSAGEYWRRTALLFGLLSP